MKKSISIILVIIIHIYYIGANSTPEQTIKRRILILPFLNKNKVESFDYLSDILMETLRAELLETKMFNFTNFSLTNYKIKQLGYTNMDIIETENAKKIALQLNADLVIAGQYVVIENQIMILIHAIDIFSGDLAAVTKINGEIGIDIFKFIDTTSKDMVKKILENLPLLEKSYHEKSTKKQKKKNTLVLKNKYNLLPINKTGIALTVSGSILFLTGLSILIYDTASYSNTVTEKRNNYLDTGENYSDYDKSYNIFIGLFSSSLALGVTGIIMTSIGIPLSTYRKKDKKVSFNITLNNKINFDVSLKL